MNSKSIKTASLDDIRAMERAGELHETVDGKAGEELGRDFWAHAQIVRGKAPRSVHLKIDADVFDYFKQQGKGHLTKMQDVLKAYMLAHRDR